MQVGGAFVRLRPTISDEDAARLAAIRQLGLDIADAFERFYATTGPSCSCPDAGRDKLCPEHGDGFAGEFALPTRSSAGGHALTGN